MAELLLLRNEITPKTSWFCIIMRELYISVVHVGYTKLYPFISSIKKYITYIYIDIMYIIVCHRYILIVHLVYNIAKGL